MHYLDSLVGVLLVLLWLQPLGCGTAVLHQVLSLSVLFGDFSDCECGAFGCLYSLDCSRLCTVNLSVLPLQGFWWQLGSGAGAAGGQSS